MYIQTKTTELIYKVVEVVCLYSYLTFFLVFPTCNLIVNINVLKDLSLNELYQENLSN